jgi:hypothetical protein
MYAQLLTRSSTGIANAFTPLVTVQSSCISWRRAYLRSP